MKQWHISIIMVSILLGCNSNYFDEVYTPYSTEEYAPISKVKFYSVNSDFRKLDQQGLIWVN